MLVVRVDLKSELREADLFAIRRSLAIRDRISCDLGYAMMTFEYKITTFDHYKLTIFHL